MARSSTVSISPWTWSKNCAHLRALGGAEDTGLGEVVDEEAVALVGRDPPGAGVGLDQVALALEGHHLGAHGGRGDLHPGCAGHVGGADRLGGLDVLGHHGLEDGGPAVVEGARRRRRRSCGAAVSVGGVMWVPGTQVYRVPGPGTVERPGQLRACPSSARRAAAQSYPGAGPR